MTMGKGGKNTYWFTEGDARRTCEAALGKVTFLVTVPPNHQFQFIVGKRVVAGQWISEDSEFDTGLIGHITMTIDRLTLSLNDLKPSGEKGKSKRKEKEEPKTFHANLQVSGLHYTVRKKTDSDWLEKNIDKVVADQKKKTNSPEVIRYKQIQTNSLHRGLNSSEWNSGNKDKNADARAALNFSNTSTLFPGDLDKVKGMISTVGAEALKNKVFKYEKGNERAELTVSSAAVIVA
jgi:hypothetical protein